MIRLKELFPIKFIWKEYRKIRIIRKHKLVGKYWESLLEPYFTNQLVAESSHALQQLPSKKIIWQYWAQGFEDENIPEIVKICTKSVDNYKNEYIVIHLSDQNISDYIQLPDYILHKKKQGIINHTFFSDILRVSLLSSYGGVWLDATILLTSSLPEKYFISPYFVYQRDPTEPKKSFWESSYAYYWGWSKGFKVNMLNSIYFSESGNIVTTTIKDLLYIYWKENNDVIDYFMFQILYDVLINKYFQNERCDVVSDVYPHLLQTKFNSSADFSTYETIVSATNIHKLSYFNEQAMKLVRSFVNQNKSIH